MIMQILVDSTCNYRSTAYCPPFLKPSATHCGSVFKYSDDELRFMYENGQGHLTLFCIVFVWLRGRPSTVRSPIQDPWFMYQNRLGPSGGIYYPNFVPCFVYHQLNIALHTCILMSSILTVVELNAVCKQRFRFANLWHENCFPFFQLVFFAKVLVIEYPLFVNRQKWHYN